LSLAVLHIVWEFFEGDGGLLLLALALADYCGDDRGTRIYPSVAELARKTRQDRRTVQRQLRKLEESGWLKPMEDEPGRGRTRRYRIDPAFIEKGGNLPLISRIKGGNQSRKGGIAAPPEPKEPKTLEGRAQGQSQYRCAACGGAAVVGHGASWYCRTHDPMRAPILDTSGPSPP